jgi:hypothetical protein
MRSVLTAVRKSWCYSMHPAPMWPINGHYICPRCQTKYPVPWEQDASTAPMEKVPPSELSSNAVEIKQAA